LACETDRIDSLVLATLSHRDLVRSVWLPDRRVREERELARFRLHLVEHKSMLKNRVPSSLISFGKPCPVTDLFGPPGHSGVRRVVGPGRPGARATAATAATTTPAWVTLDL